MTLVASRQQEEVVDDLTHGNRLLTDARKRFPGLVVELIKAEADVEFGPHRCERSAEFMRGVGDQPLAGLNATLNAPEHCVQRTCEVSEFVVNRRRRDPLGKITNADALGPARHLVNRVKRAAGDPPSPGRDESECPEAPEKDQHEHAVDRAVDVRKRLDNDEHLASAGSRRGACHHPKVKLAIYRRT